jgi:hypothetical protein
MPTVINKEQKDEKKETKRKIYYLKKYGNMTTDHTGTYTIKYNGTIIYFN